MGTMANELTLGCDCLGQIHYLVRLARFVSIILADPFSSPVLTSLTMAQRLS